MFRGIVLFAFFTMTISVFPTGRDNGNDPKDAGLHDNGKHNGQKDRSGEVSAAPSNGSSPIPSDFSSPAPIYSASASLSPIDATTEDPSYNIPSVVSSPNPSISEAVSDASFIYAETSSAAPSIVA
ncbi:hypothetical protein L596_028292 [Steinernema carpocapsae]|uniref:Uncharacterized protein n=1 Tax=Steinernema carpocapsae TaxID=34508 RepID=A0A4U5LY20_STECR|nr:hypothetical protein L596_028292 [Steinernema carpocapsae]